MAPQVIVFIDYQNMHMSGHEQWCAMGDPPEDCLIHPLKVAEMLVSRRAPGGILKQVRVYRGRPESRLQPRLAAATDRQAHAWQTADDRVLMKRRPLWYPKGFGEPGCYEAAREKGIDVSLAVDMVRMAIEKTYEVGILFSRDTDMLPALETIVDLRVAHVETAGWEGTSRLRLPSGGMKLYTHFLSADDFTSVRDRSYY